MQKLVKVEDKRQSPIQGSRALLQSSNNGAHESPIMNPIKNLKLEFPRLQGEDPTCWIYRTNQFFSYHNTPDHQKVIMASYHLDGEALT